MHLGDGPHLPERSGPVPLRQGLSALAVPRFRAAAGGYLGHMWELYAFWTLTPLLVGRELQRLELAEHWIAWGAFAVIAMGAIGCVLGGWLSRSLGSAWVARRALATSGLVAVAYPLLGEASPWLLLALLMVWGLAVVADSPQFSALAAAYAPRASVGSSLAVMNSVGFGLTLPAIWLTSALWQSWGLWVVALLWPGPLLGLWAFRTLPSGAGSARV